MVAEARITRPIGMWTRILLLKNKKTGKHNPSSKASKAEGHKRIVFSNFLYSHNDWARKSSANSTVWGFRGILPYSRVRRLLQKRFFTRYGEVCNKYPELHEYNFELRHATLYIALLKVVRAIARQEALLPLLDTLPSQSKSVYALLSDLDSQSKVFLKRLTSSSERYLP